ncbi:hypothetical protein BT63DRAFT_67553 [Microthyrium microscopicum]|uniref:Uncharacterized protein n=1 Tax=Microthyrium microscopicum TaxID=703497 RepID=A0A6A6TZN8_9PEZI|nr:hypothetical protein BT63DRAFT_67553 [Microthyrium microscopicum]
MDSHERRSRHSNAGFGASQAGATGASGLLNQSTGQYPSVSAAGDRYQVRGTSQLPSAASTGRGANMPSYSYPANAAGAYPELNSSNLQYGGASADYGASQDSTQRASQQAQQHQSTHAAQQQQTQQNQQQPHQGQQPYHGIYGQQPSPTSPYDPVQQYPPRQSAAIEVLSNQFGGVTPAYYVAGETGPTSAPNTAITPQSGYNPISYTTQSPVGRDSLASAYAAGMADPSQATGSQPGYGQPASYSNQTAELDNAFGSYQDALRRSFESIRDGNLAEAGNTMISITDWLLSNAEVLGLVRDDESTHAERLKLWSEFNTCWLALLQRQRELAAEMIQIGQRPAPPASLLEYDQMETMGKELIRLCDNMEKHGLVDYQMGVWEEDIISLLSLCLEQLNPDPEGHGSGAVNNVPQPSSSRGRR